MQLVFYLNFQITTSLLLRLQGWRIFWKHPFLVSKSPISQRRAFSAQSPSYHVSTFNPCWDVWLPTESTADLRLTIHAYPKLLLFSSNCLLSSFTCSLLWSPDKVFTSIGSALLCFSILKPFVVHLAVCKKSLLSTKQLSFAYGKMF